MNRLLHQIRMRHGLRYYYGNDLKVPKEDDVFSDVDARLVSLESQRSDLVQDNVKI